MSNWKKLSDELPTGDEYAVLLYPVRSDVGIMYTVSNPEFARVNGIGSGFTHWCNFELAPGHHKMHVLLQGDYE